MAAPDLPSKRYRLLVEQLGQERHFRHGWRSEVARMLDVHPSLISRVMSEKGARIGRDVIDRAVQKLGIDPRFFFDPKVEATPAGTDYFFWLQRGAPEPRTPVKRRVELDNERALWEQTRETVERTMRIIAREPAEARKEAQELLDLLRLVPMIGAAIGLKTWLDMWEAYEQGDRHGYLQFMDEDQIRREVISAIGYLGVAIRDFNDALRRPRPQDRDEE